MTLEVNDDGSGPPAAGADLDAAIVDVKSVAEAGFEAGLSVIIEAIPRPAIVIDRSCRVLASNRPARGLVRNLQRAQRRTALFNAVADVIQSGETCHVRLSDGTGGLHAHLVTPLMGSCAHGRALYLVLREDHGPAAQAAPTQPPLLHYELGPAPARSLREQAMKFKRLSETDPLTGALNVRAFAACVRRALAQAPRRKGAMIFLDLNQFKQINDAFGHAAGDKVLRHVAAKLTFPPHTWIATARMGGDEFALWVPSVERANLAKVIAGIRARLQMPVDLSEFASGPAQLTASAAVGAVHCPDEALNYDTMRQIADKRMYDDKLNATDADGSDPMALLKRKGAVDPAPQSFLPR